MCWWLYEVLGFFLLLDLCLQKCLIPTDYRDT